MISKDILYIITEELKLITLNWTKSGGWEPEMQATEQNTRLMSKEISGPH